jgi:hypothetical protein
MADLLPDVSAGASSSTVTLVQPHLLTVLIQNPLVLTAAAEPLAGFDLGDADPILMALLLSGTLTLPSPTPDPDSYGPPEAQVRAMRGVCLTLPTPCVVEGRPTLPRFWGRSESLATSQLGGSGG